MLGRVEDVEDVGACATDRRYGLWPDKALSQGWGEQPGFLAGSRRGRRGHEGEGLEVLPREVEGLELLPGKGEGLERPGEDWIWSLA